MKKTIGLFALGALSVGTVAQASVVALTGSVTQIAAPTSVSANVLEDSTQAVVFDEQQGVMLEGAVNVDYKVSTGVAGAVVGTRVSSYFIHFDPEGAGGYLTGDSPVGVSGSVTFSNRIIGIIWSGVDAPNAPSTPDYLDDSDFLGAAGTTYATGEMGRGLELDDYFASAGTQDTFSVSADGKTVSFDLNSFPVRTDQLRVLTAVPVPPALWLLASGMVFLVRAGRRKVASAT